jgi:hypothetical protein
VLIGVCLLHDGNHTTRKKWPPQRQSNRIIRNTITQCLFTRPIEQYLSPPPSPRPRPVRRLQPTTCKSPSPLSLRPQIVDFENLSSLGCWRAPPTRQAGIGLAS